MPLYKVNSNIIEYEDRLEEHIATLSDHLYHYHSEKEYNIHDEVDSLIKFISTYIVRSGLYEDVTFHIDKAEDVREVIKHGKAYFVEAIYNQIMHDDPSSQYLEKKMIDFAFFSIELASIHHIEDRAITNTTTTTTPNQ